MYLKKISIQGFKSFARKTCLDFDQGITGVVGPNGSGKSNVSDAIKWVLGEQSMKNLRSKKSEDVIFSGSEKASKASMAEVSLDLDNSNKVVPIDFTDVTITRRVYRSGESEYLLNGAKARLMDITEILSKSGFGRSTYTVIGQGMVDKLITQTAEERRELFQDASGVKHFYLKRDQALKKFKETKENIIRVSDVLREIKPRLNSLERQQKEAEERKIITSKVLDLQKKYYGSELFDIENSLNENEKKFLEIQKEYKNVQSEVALITDKLEKRNQDSQKDFLYSKEKELDNLESEIQNLQDELFNQVKKNALLVERKKYFSDNLPKLEGEFKKISEIIFEKENQIKNIKEKQSNLKLELEELIISKNDIEKDSQKKVEPKQIINSIKNSLEKILSEIKSGLSNSIIYKSIENLIVYIKKNHTDNLEDSVTEHIKIELKIDKIKSEIDSWDKLISEAFQVIAVQKEKKDLLEKEINEAKNYLKQDNLKNNNLNIEEQINDLRNKKDEIKKEIEIIKAKSQEKENEFFEIEKSYREKRDLESSYKDEMTRVEIELARLKTRKEDIKEELIELNIKEDFLEKSNIEEKERQQILKDINSLRHKLEYMGGAISKEYENEYEEVKKRYEFLISQSEDLEEAIKNTKKVVTELEEKISEQFHKNFEKISQKFNYYFGKLFGGGSAKLILREGENEEEMVIDIQAIPPGKRMHTLNTLSGGEKSLTSVALLFAIFSVNPTPFCVLDEVDAALDESNTMRFAELLFELSTKTQFIVVTHNRETMKKAKNLYGVTMDESKISKVLSLRLEDAQKYSK
ncbi:MAG: AAA family ATPase [Candidatus Woesearchaeota archaeon]